MYLSMYNGLLWVASPFIKRHLNKRLEAGKEDASRFDERFGEPSRLRPSGELIWFHAASVGEAISALPLIKVLLARNSKRSILMTTGTKTSADLMQDRLPAGAFHQFVPIDTKEAVTRFLEYWQPQLAIWMESEIWPNLIHQTSRRKIPMLMINARITDASFNLWRKTGGLAKNLLKKFDYIHAQSELAAERMKYLGGEDVEALGNLKFCSPPLPFQNERFRDMRAAIKDRKVWLASSTHKGEEAIVASVHLAMKSKVKNLLTIIAPRHPSRGEEIASKLQEAGFKVAQRSLRHPIEPDTDIYLADTIGELGLFYRLVDVVFMGGSLVQKGGQNLLEAARLDCAIMHGPDMSNFTEIVADLQNNNGIIQVNNGSELAAVTYKLMSELRYRSTLAENATEVVTKGEALLGHLVKRIEDTLVETD
ncbi:MAG: 3-deoxy-D-manno-octulosonic acid transferase [Sneathiella sp.]|nr:3-deoxy-D-manno-octulosonic acid transferase [Sneathiella sp.]